ncbi:MAG: hypothetical protein HWN65_06815 [Candidatus Helarchaeota archaeon]|nr:hypothetical protein [Candidatus Helarchaeota archaeon]
MKTIKELLAEIEYKYNKNPAGWNILVGGRDPHGHGNLFISNPVHVWQIKIDSLFKPNPYGVGMKLGNVEDFELPAPRAPSFGFRPLLPSHLNKLRQTVEQEKPINQIVDAILNTKPLSLSQIGKSNFLMGPIMHSSFKGYVSDKQKELDKKLRKNLDDLLLSKGIGYNYI